MRRIQLVIVGQLSSSGGKALSINEHVTHEIYNPKWTATPAVISFSVLLSMSYNL